MRSWLSGIRLTRPRTCRSRIELLCAPGDVQGAGQLCPHAEHGNRLDLDDQLLGSPDAGDWLHDGELRADRARLQQTRKDSPV